MPFDPSRNQTWPPPEWAPEAALIAEGRAWLTGDLNRIVATGKTSAGWRARLAARLAKKQTDPTAVDGQHVAFARLVADTSAALLFGSDPPMWTVPGAGLVDVDGDGQPEPPSVEQQALIAAQDRIGELATVDGWYSKLHHAAWIASGLGGVVLRPVYGDRMTHPTLTVVHHDHCIPTFEWGVLVEAVLWRDVEVDVSGNIWRHLEIHTAGKVEHSLWYGTTTTLGARRDLSAHRSTSGLIGADKDGIIDLRPIIGDQLLVDYVPNKLPHPVTLSTDIGGADTAGLEGRMAALDQTATGWDADVRLGKPRVMVPDQFLIRDGSNGTARFDSDQEVFSPIRVSALDTGQTIEVIQFEVRADQFAASKADLMQELSLAAGYNPESVLWASDSNGQMTATEVLSRDAKTRDTTNSKRTYFAPALAAVAYKMLQIERHVYKSPVEPVEPVIEWPTVDQVDDAQIAQTINTLSVAGAISIEEKVRTRRPEWTDSQVAAEVARIHAEQGVTVDDPTGRY